MAKLFPFRPSEGPDIEREPKLVNIDDEGADVVFAALSSDTAREILAHLYEEPSTASDVADAVDTSLQNARYHLEKLQSAGLIEDVDTWYSSRGTEMTVYGPTSEPLVVAAGEEESRSVLRSALKRVVGAVGILGLASVAVDRLARRFGGVGFAGAGGAGGAEPQSTEPTEETELAAAGGETTTPTLDDAAEFRTAATTETPTEMATGTPVAMETPTRAATSTPTATPTAAPSPTSTSTPEPIATPGTSGTEIATTTPEATEVSGGMTEAPTTVFEATDAATRNATAATPTAVPDAAGPLASLPPGLLFFVGGLFVMALVAVWWYRFQYRPLYHG